MSPSLARCKLDRYNQSKLELWHAAAGDLASGPERGDPLVQASLHAVLEWLRAEAAEPAVLFELFGRPHGPLGGQVRLIGSLLAPEETPRVAARQLYWTVAKAAYYARWRELIGASEAS